MARHKEIADRARSGFAKIADLHPHVARTGRLFAPLCLPDGGVNSLADDLVLIHRAHRTIANNLEHISGPCAAHLLALLRILRRVGLAEEWEKIGETFTDFSTDDDLLIYGRPDCILTDTGLQVVETNFDTGIAGIDLTSDLLKLVCNALNSEGAEIAESDDPVAVLTAFIASKILVPQDEAELEAEVHWISTTSLGRQKMCDALANSLNAVKGVPMRVRHVMNHPTIPFIPKVSAASISRIHRSVSFYTIMANPEPFHTAFRHLMLPGMQHIVPSGNGVLSSKAFLALASSNATARSYLTRDELIAIDRRIPWTASLLELNDSERSEILRDQDAYVLKLSDSYRSLAVHFGARKSNAEWRALLEKAEKENRDRYVGHDFPHHWIIQKRVFPKSQPVAELTDTGWKFADRNLSICPFLFGREIGGFFVTDATTNPGAIAESGEIITMSAMRQSNWDLNYGECDFAIKTQSERMKL